MESAETSRSRRLSAVVLLPALLALQACYEDSEPLPAAAEGVTLRGGEEIAGAWLEPGSREAPADWLSRLSGEDGDDLAALIRRADSRWREDPRMIANRFAGLWRDTGQVLPLTGLIEAFLKLPPGGEATLSALIQSYRVLRDQGSDHATALRALTGIRHD